jgi:transcriptional regulator with XRE-family HTH domain
MERQFQLNWTGLVEEAIRRRRGLNLTQKQLAVLAKVSAPTISRFEQNAKDIQLSSVLQILDALGMTDKRTLVFPDQGYTTDLADCIVFWGQDGDQRVKCRVSREALEDHFSDRDRLRPKAAFEKNRADIEGLVRRKYFLGHLEPDGSVLLRTDDIG